MCFFIFNTSSCTDIIFVMNNLVIWEDWPEKKIGYQANVLAIIATRSLRN